METRTRLRELIAALRERAGGARAILLDRDRRVRAVDGPTDVPSWQVLLGDIDDRWERWREWERSDAFTSTTGVIAFVHPLGDGAFAIAELGSGSTLGLARLRTRHVIEALDRALAQPAE